MTPLLAAIVETQRETLELAGMPSGWLRLLALLVLVGMCGACVWLYRRERRSGASPRIRAALATLRVAVMLILAGVWLEPVMATYTQRTISARVVVLVDRSTSMAITDGTEGADAAADERTRMQRVLALLAAPDAATLEREAASVVGAERLTRSPDHAWLKRLALRNELSLLAFGDAAAPAALPWSSTAAAASQPAGLEDALRPSDAHTDLGAALTRVRDELGESPLAALVVISDGAINHGMSPDDVAAYAGRFKAPIFTVGVGRTTEPVNIRVSAVRAPAAVARGDPLELRVDLSATGLEATRVRVELSARGLSEGGGAERVVGAQDAEVGGQSPAAELRFMLSADQAGEFLYTARVEPLPEEPVRIDNQRAASVLVLDQTMRVLLVAGKPGFDFQFISTLLKRDRTIDVSCWLQSADVQAVREGDVVVTELPRKPEEILSYDAILLLDPDPREFDAAWATQARKLVDDLGGGLMFVAGTHFSSRFLRDERLADLVATLPITPDPEVEMRISAMGSHQTRALALRIPEEARGDALLRMSADPVANQAVLDALPGVWWHLPVLREKSLARVLMRAAGGSLSDKSEGAVLFAVQPFGAGRTVFLGFDSTWRWRATGERYFARFWIQTVRYLAQARRQGGSRRGSILLDRDVVSVGDYVKIEARLLDGSFLPWTEPEVAATYQIDDGEPAAARLTAIAGREGWYAGRILLDHQGTALIKVAVPASGEAPAESLIKYVQVQPPDVELRTLRVQTEALTTLSEATGGGRYVRLEDAADLPAEIPNASQIRVIPGPRRALWDRGALLGVLATLLCVEWFVRRRNHLL